MHRGHREEGAALARFSLGGFADERAGGAGMVFVPRGYAGGITGDEDVIADDVEGEAAIDMEGRAFVFV